MGFYYSPGVRKVIYNSAKWVNDRYGKTAFRQGKRAVSRLPGMKKKKVVKVAPKKTTPRRKGFTKTQNKIGSQWTQTKTNIALSRPMTSAQRSLALIKASKQQTIYRYNAVKSFDDNGYFFMSHFQDVNSNVNLPLYTFDLTACINQDTSGGVVLRGKPMSSAYVDPTGDIYFYSRSGLQKDGVTVDDNLQLERSTQGDVVVYPNSKDMLKWASVKMNLWGCKSRSTKYKVMLVRFKDDRVIPHHETLPNVQRTEMLQSILKPYVFNPIATTQNNLKYKMDIIKEQTFQLEDTDTSSTDQDPHVRNVNWFVRLDRLCNYVETGQKLTGTNLREEADFIQSIGSQNSCYVQPKSRLFLMIIASNYGRDTAITNVETPSFDINVRLCHESLT